MIQSKGKKIATVALGLAGIITAITPLSAAVTTQDCNHIGKLCFQGSTTIGPTIVSCVGPYNSTHPGVMSASDILQPGSGDGRTATQTHVTDIGMSSGTWLTSDYGGVVKGTAIARDGVVFIVNTSVTGLIDISPDDIFKIYSNAKTNWNQITDSQGHVGPDMTIVCYARNIGSGTRASMMDPAIKSDGYGFALNTSLKLNDTQEAAAVDNRVAENVDMQAAINGAAATGAIGYVGMGFDTGANIKSLGIWYGAPTRISWAPSAINMYAPSPANPNIAAYPYGRFLWLCTATDWTPTNKTTDVDTFISWMTQTNGTGQQKVIDNGFMPLIPSQDVVVDNTVDVLDLIGVGNFVGATVTPSNIRADVKADGAVDVLDLIAVGNWVGTNVLAVQHIN